MAKTSNSIDLSQWLPAVRQIPQYGQKLFEAFQALIDQTNQAHANAGVSASTLAPPPRLDDFQVTKDTNGFVYFGIKHNAPIQKGIQYFVEHADNPAFTGAHLHVETTSRNPPPLFIGNSTRYFRAYAMYQGSNVPSPIMNFGGETPTAVTGGGTAPAAFQQSFGAGTAPTDGSKPGQGFGPVLYRAQGQ
jgi:hypothetical protein